MASLGWLVLFLVFLGVELLFRCFISLWFAAGAAAAFILSFWGASEGVQLLGFAVVSFLTFILIRPAVFFFGRHRRRGRSGGQD